MRKIIPVAVSLKIYMLLCIALFYYPSNAQTPHIDSLLQVLKSQKEDTLKANTLFDITRAYLFELNDYQKVGEYGLQQLELSRKLNFKKGIAYGLLNRGIYYWGKGDFTTAMDYQKKSLVLMLDIASKKGESSCYINIGLNYSNMGEYNIAIEYLLKAIKVKEELQDKKGMAASYSNISNIYLTQGKHSKALQYQLSALKIAEESKDSTAMSVAYHCVGNIFNAQNKSEEALQYYFKAAIISEKFKNMWEISNVYESIGTWYFKNKNYKEALRSYFKALAAQETIQDKRNMAFAYSGIGKVYLKEKELTKSHFYHRKALELYLKIGDKEGLTQAYGGLGDLYREKGDVTAALENYNKMVVIAKELDYKEALQEAYQNFALLYKKQGEFEKALEYTTLYNNIKDSLLNKENFKQVSELNTRYETDKKEKEILLLTKDQELAAKIIKQQQLVRWGLIGGLLLLFVSIFSIYRRYRFKQKANDLLEAQKKEIQEKNTLITDSIDYAKTIQEAVLPTPVAMQKLFPQSFVLNRPKAIVSGDFYWISKVGNQLVCAVADCTGHGVPGAFMSLLGYNVLENEVKKTTGVQPSVILDNLNAEILKNFSKAGEIVKHGMDISLISIDTETNQLQYAGAHNSLYMVRNGQLIELKADKKGIGSVHKNKSDGFTNQIIELQKGDMIYLHTDGFPDQIGGPNRKKFYYQPFKDLLAGISKLEVAAQKNKLEDAHLNWLGNKMDQTDDILIMGIRW
jgi:serine phosphatase RsbU (regulator of sigma subunit)